MDRHAIFIDAGYLYAQGSTAICGRKRKRTETFLDPEKIVNLLKGTALERVPGTKLLRIYWYDGALYGSRPTAVQAKLAHSNDVKLRLGFINSQGQQKGVDSLIVTDLIEISRLGSLSDAFLLSGDEDVRVGVQIAQNYGVRIHLIGIVPSRGSQSQQLMQESDTTEEWDREKVETFLTVRETVESEVVASSQTQNSNNNIDESTISALDGEVTKIIGELGSSDISSLSEYWSAGNRGIPPDYDRLMLVRCRETIERDLIPVELRHVRVQFRKFAAERTES